MRVSADTPLVDRYLVFQVGADVREDDPFSKYRMTLMGRLAAADDEEGWVDQYQDDGRVERIRGRFVITTAAELLH